MKKVSMYNACPNDFPVSLPQTPKIQSNYNNMCANVQISQNLL